MANIFNEYFIEKHDCHDHEHEDEGSPVVAKSVAMAVLFLASFTIGCIPIKLSKMFNWQTNPKNNKVVNMLLCFGGGVLLCTTFLHLLPEVSEHIAELVKSKDMPDLKMHFAEFLMCVGFFTMYLVEELVHFYLHRRQAKNDELGALRRSLSIRRGELNGNITMSTSELVNSMEETKANPLEFQPHTNGHIHHHQDAHAGHSHLMIESNDNIVKSLRGLLVVLALSVHELFEGLAVGLESSPSTVWYMFGAVSAHKLVIAFCIGVELVSTKTRTLLTVIYVFTFAIVSPMGIGIGILVSDNNGPATDIASAVLQGLASGTLLYVVFFEILQKDQHGGLKQYFSTLLGFIVMFAITMIGIGTGIALSGSGTSEIDVTSVVLQGMAAGTLLYVVFFEVLARERNNKHGGIWQLLAIIAGFAVMFTLQILTGHGHSHEGHEESPCGHSAAQHATKPDLTNLF